MDTGSFIGAAIVRRARGVGRESKGWGSDRRTGAICNLKLEAAIRQLFIRGFFTPGIHLQERIQSAPSLLVE